jgi:hypothetical protein
LHLTGYLVQSSFCDRDLFPEGFQLGYRWRAITHVGTVFPSEHLTKYSLDAYFSVQTYQNVTTFQVRVIVVAKALTSEPSQRGVFGGEGHLPNENTSRQSDLFHYGLEGPNFTYGKQILHIS